VKWDLAKAFKHQIVLLSGAEDALRMNALRELIKESAQGDDFDLETFMADAAEPLQWLASAGTTPFLSPRRTVVVRNFLRRDNYKDFSPGPLPETALLILVADDEPGDQDKQRRLETLRTNWEKTIAKIGGAVFDFAVDANQIQEEIKSRAQEHGKKISPKAAGLLREMSGGSLSRSLQEIEKIVVFVGKAEEIYEKDIRAIAIASPEWNIFKLIDSITRAETGEALRQLQMLIGTNPKVEDVIFRTIFPLLTSQLETIWQARACIEVGVSPTNAPTEVSAAFLDRPNISRLGDWQRNKAMTSARALNFDALAKCFKAMADCDSRLKGALPSFSARDTLERMVLEMIEAVRGAPSLVAAR